MNRIPFVVGVGLALAALPAAPAAAQASRTFVSGHGNDANNCSLTAPCRSFAGAFAVTNSGGEIDVLDAAGYGVLTINKAISIVNDGVGTSSILVPPGGIGITINAGTSDAISLRGLTIEGAGTGATGIKFNTGGSLTVANSVIRHVGTDGIDFEPNATSNLAVSNTLVADNDGNGIKVFPSGSGIVTAVFNRIEVNNNANDGIFMDGEISTGTVNCTASDSVAAHNGVGFYVNSTTGQAPTTIMLFHSVTANNVYGIYANGTGAILRAAQSMVTGNTSGWQTVNGGAVLSFGDNYIDGNGSHETAPPTNPPAKK